jgi:hypothetical protein
MSSAPQPDAGAGASEQDALEPEEVLDAVPVLVAEPTVLTAARSAELERRGAMMPAVQAAAVAAGGFVAGAAVVGLVHRRHRRALMRGARGAGKLTRGGSRRAGRAGELVQIVGSRSLLVDVHLLGGSDSDR